jgi:hypothetical protein
MAFFPVNHNGKRRKENKEKNQRAKEKNAAERV